MASPTEISALKLFRLIGTPKSPLIIDVCIDEDFQNLPCLIPGARRCRFQDIESIAGELAGRKTIVVCQKGLKLSQGAAALLRTHGVDAEHLQGGMLGWRDAELPLIPANSIPRSQDRDHTLWVTRARPKIDRIACPWLIRRFVDPAARFLFVASSQVELVADRFDATPFDMPEGFWTHRDNGCTFDTMLDEFCLEIPALREMAKIVRAADTDKLQDSAQAAGLLALSVGLSKQHSDDLEQLDAAMPIYDALYRWARDGMDENHDWPYGKAAS